MKIRDLFTAAKPLYSFEFFPPKTDAGADNLYATVKELAPFSPAYVSVTYGAGGSTQERTLEIVSRINHQEGITAMAHLTCVGATSDELAGVVDRLVDAGVENIIALRGDPPAGHEIFKQHQGGFAHATDLVGFLRKRHGDKLSVAAACYPEGHVECTSGQDDLRHLKSKVDAGVDFLITQLFFDNAVYFEFVKNAKSLGINVPIVPGIMPVVNVGQIERFTKMCGATLPKDFHGELNAARDNQEAVAEIGIQHAVTQCVELIKGGAPGIHFYTLNRSAATREILKRLKALL